MRVSFAKFPLLNKIKTLCHKLLVRQMSNHHHCDWHPKIPILSSDFEQFFLVKNNFEYLLTSVHNDADDTDAADDIDATDDAVTPLRMLMTTTG